MNSTKAQMKIQQMAFMLVAVMIFFAMVAIVYFTILFSKIHGEADNLREQEAKELARQMSSTPELMFSKKANPYSATIDFDKAFFLSQNAVFKEEYWNIDYLMIERLYPPSSDECTHLNYPNCAKLLIINNADGKISGTQTAPVALAWWNESIRGGNGDFQFGFGRIHVLAHDPQN